MGVIDPIVYRDKPFEHKILKADIPIYLDSDGPHQGKTEIRIL